MTRRVAVIDIGKTNAKVALVDTVALSELAVLTTPNPVLAGPPYRHFDTGALWRFVLGALAALHRDHGVHAVTVTTHGAAAALLAADGSLAAPVMDYEDPGPDNLADEYDALRSAFALTGSPRLPGGLNLGAQLYWQMRRDPSLRRRIDQIVSYPQYWGFRLTGVAATEVTSLGCHTDLWLPRAGRPSALVDRLGLAGRLAPLRRAGDVLGPLLPAVAARTGLAPDTPVFCGLHDSNASLVPHLLARQGAFAVVSTGTWVVSMAVGAQDVPLDAARDVLVNVNTFGVPVPSARFMGGREHDLLLGQDAPVAGARDIPGALAKGAMLLPSVEQGSGPFQGRQARWLGAEPARGSAQRSATVGFYLALMTAQCLELVGAQGPVIVEGPFGRNDSYLDMLGAATGRAVLTPGTATGTATGAALLTLAAPPALSAVAARVPVAAMRGYAERWRATL